MNMMLKIILLFALLTSTVTGIVYAQPNTFLENFKALENSGKVYLDWTIASGNTCNGIRIYRSIDSLNFIYVGSIGGICGSSSKAIRYQFTDEHPVLNAYNYYQLEFGGNGISEIVSVQVVDFGANRYQIRPNPIVDEAQLYFNNGTQQKHQLTIYDLNGRRVFTASTQDSFFELSTVDMYRGVYVFTIISEDNIPKATGKILVSH